MVVAIVACSDSSDGPRRRAKVAAHNEDAGTPEPDAVSSGPSCANGVRDGDETDTDCGGAICPACALGRACAAAGDCVSRACTNAKCENASGCADGTREAFADVATFPDIAACSGAWSVPGLASTTSPACGRDSGNDSRNPEGTGCNVADLCQVGWHVCGTGAEVAAKTGPAGCAAATVAGHSAFFAVRQSGDGSATCGAGTNDLFGCGGAGVAPDTATCTPLDRFSNDLCAALPSTWACGTDGTNESNAVTKTASDGGGVLCCRD
jgi:hypothetical protein